VAGPGQHTPPFNRSDHAITPATGFFNTTSHADQDMHSHGLWQSHRAGFILLSWPRRTTGSSYVMSDCPSTRTVYVTNPKNSDKVNGVQRETTQVTCTRITAEPHVIHRNGEITWTGAPSDTCEPLSP